MNPNKLPHDWLTLSCFTENATMKFKCHWIVWSISSELVLKSLFLFTLFLFHVLTQYSKLLTYDTHTNVTSSLNNSPTFIWKNHRLPNDIPGPGKMFLVNFLFLKLCVCFLIRRVNSIVYVISLCFLFYLLSELYFLRL